MSKKPKDRNQPKSQFNPKSGIPKIETDPSGTDKQSPA